MEFPITHDKCPICGSEVSVGKEILKGEQEKGKAGENVIPCVFQQQAIIADPRRITSLLTVPMITSLFDVCECGAVYCVYADVMQAAPKLDQSGMTK